MKSIILFLQLTFISINAFGQNSTSKLEITKQNLNTVKFKIDSLQRVKIILEKRIDSLKMVEFPSDYILKWGYGKMKEGSTAQIIRTEGEWTYINNADCQGCKVPSHYLRNEREYQAKMKQEAEARQIEEQARKLRSDSVMKVFYEKQAIREKEEALRNEQEKKEQAAQLAIRKKELVKKYGEVNAKRILEQKIWIGMNKEMAIESWGQPNDINRTVGSWGTHEQWVYGSQYLYFENGKLTSWQD